MINRDKSDISPKSEMSVLTAKSRTLQDLSQNALRRADRHGLLNDP